MTKLLLTISFLILFKSITAGSPRISFFCELPEKEFVELFSDSMLIKDLIEMKVSIRIGLHDFGSGRTKVVRDLNFAGIPVYAWLLLPEEEGYWFNANNVEKAMKRYEDFKKWSAENKLVWAGIGLDIEPDMNDAKLALTHPWKFALKSYMNLYRNKALEKSKNDYQSIISEMKSDGFRVESYIIPFLFEERAKKATSVQKLLGIVDIETDIEIPMLYTSMMNNPGILPAYIRKGMPAGIGSTGGGVNVDGFELAALSWEKLERDLLIASRLTDEVVIFCLETSVKKGYLEKVKNLDFSKNPPDITIETARQKKFNRFIGTVIVILEHPVLMTAGILAIIAAVFFALFKLVYSVVRLLRH